MEIRRVPMSEINPAPYNPRIDLRHGNPEYDKLRRSIEEFGLVQVLVWNQRTGYLVGGHQTLKILKARGDTDALCCVVDLADSEEKALNIALNRIRGDWDMPKLQDLLTELQGHAADLSLTGFDMAELDQLLSPGPPGVREDDFDAEAEVEKIADPVTRPGDLWLLGRHRLLCGDATVPSDVKRLTAGQNAAMAFTDPPYNVNYVGKGRRALKIDNDNMTPEAFRAFLQAAFANMLDATAPGGAVYICHPDGGSTDFRLAAESSGWAIKQTLIWVKSQFVIGRQDYHWRHEPILYGWRPGAGHRWYGGRRQATVLEDPVGLVIADDLQGATLTFSQGPYAVVLKVRGFEMIHDSSAGDSSVWRFDKPTKNVDHPTMKPVRLCARAISNSSRPEEAVLDPFGGSGSTLIAAEQLRRSCLCMELSPSYCDVIVRRWETFSGQAATRVTAP